TSRDSRCARLLRLSHRDVTPAPVGAPPAPEQPRNTDDAEESPYGKCDLSSRPGRRQQVGWPQSLRKGSSGDGDDLLLGPIRRDTAVIFRGADDGTVTPCSRRRELRHAEKDKRFQIRREQRFEWCQRPLGCSRGKAQQSGAELRQADGGKKPSPVFAEIVVHLHRLLRAAFSQGDIGSARRGE